MDSEKLMLQKLAKDLTERLVLVGDERDQLKERCRLELAQRKAQAAENLEKFIRLSKDRDKWKAQAHSLSGMMDKHRRIGLAASRDWERQANGMGVLFGTLRTTVLEIAGEIQTLNPGYNAAIHRATALRWADKLKAAAKGDGAKPKDKPWGQEVSVDELEEASEQLKERLKEQLRESPLLRGQDPVLARLGEVKERLERRIKELETGVKPERAKDGDLYYPRLKDLVTHLDYRLNRHKIRIDNIEKETGKKAGKGSYEHLNSRIMALEKKLTGAKLWVAPGWQEDVEKKLAGLEETRETMVANADKLQEMGEKFQALAAGIEGQLGEMGIEG